MTVVARRYARALLEALSQDDSPGPDAGYAQLIQLRRLLDTEPDARKLLVNPVIPPERRERFVAEIGQALGLDARVVRLLGMIVERRRLQILNDLIDNYQSMLDERNGIVRALVTAAGPLSEIEQRDIALALEKSLGQRVVMDVREDRTLIGGLVVRIGSTVYDGSLRQHLEGFKERLLAS